MTVYMLTMPRNRVNKKLINLFIEENDIHKWVVGYETGKSGYKHFQVRLQFGGDFSRLKNWFSDAHIEEGSDDWKYERKSGYFVAWDDTVDVRKCRFGVLRDNQRRALQLLSKSGDREIVCWYDRRGGVGKSFLTRYCYEKGLAYYVPPTVNDPKSIIQYVCAGYQGERYILIDIPRSAKWSESLYTSIETIKDGLVYDTRYTARIRDIWGVKILVLTNSIPRLGALSRDRWKILNRDAIDCTIIAHKIAAKMAAQEKQESETKEKKKKTKKSEVDS